MTSTEQPDFSRDQLITACDSLPDHECFILQLISVIYEPVNELALAECLHRISFAPADSTMLESEKLAACLSKLKKLGLVDTNLCCNQQVIEIATRNSIHDGRFESMVVAVREIFPISESKNISHSKNYLRHIREMRIGIYTHNLELFNKYLLLLFDFPETSRVHPVIQICNNPFDINWFSALPAQIQLYSLHEILKNSLSTLTPISLPLAFLQKRGAISHIPPEGRPSFYYLLIVHLLLHGNIVKAQATLKKAGKEITSFGLRGWLFFLLGDNDKAIRYFETDLKLLQKINRKNNAYFTGIEGLFFILALFKTGDFSRLERIRKIIDSVHEIQPHNIFLPSYLLLLQIVDLQENPSDFTLSRLQSKKLPADSDSITVLFHSLARYWIDGKLENNQADLLVSLFMRARENGYSWLAMEYAELLQLSGRKSVCRNYAEKIRKKSGMISISSASRPEEPWQRALKALNCTSPSIGYRQKHACTRRLTWVIDLESSQPTIIPKEQKQSVSGKWSKGKKISLKRLLKPDKIDFLNEQDQAICATIRNEHTPWGSSFNLNHDKALPALVGHPNILLAGDPPTPAEFIKGEPELRVMRKGDMLYLSLLPNIFDENVVIVGETPSRFKIIEVTRNHRRIAKIIGMGGLTVPVSAQKKVLSTLANVSSHVTVHSAIGGVSNEIKEIPADTRIYVHLQPVGSSGFRMSFFVKPFETGGPYLKPGKGTKNVIAEISGQRMQTKRDMNLEAKNADRVETACPTLFMHDVDEREWILEKPDDCLQILLELRALEDDIIVEWPEGKKLTVSPQITFDRLNMTIRKKQNWFELKGKLQLDEDLVLDMRKLLELTSQTSSRFIPLGRGQFLTLSKELQKQLAALGAYAELGEENILVHPLAAHAIDDFTRSGIEFHADVDWEKHMNRIAEAGKFKPVIPSTMQAQLRDYQEDGYVWLARLAHWEVGACLADDMGLGKTVQALAIILARAPKGPTLVVAPTSVCMNWQEEMSRFTPTINSIIFGGKQRKKLIKELKGFDVLITSYGMLQQEADILSSIEWQTIVLDEAQAIKNIMTKRSKAAMSLKGKFRFITTGTPIENHLGELWNLFQFINPGFLGSLDHFNERFAIPIERHNDRNARRRLKELIQPFILRRIKSQVLEELPPRTEVVLQVEMSREETSFYEALRREALESLQDTGGHQGQRQLKILAEIMRLRRACCNARLVSEQITIPSSKLNLFGNIIEELLENNHKALVFSQFVGHLKIIREFLEQKNIVFQYLDGSTPARQRQKRVESFQAGEGDLFLISLKAGGLGLNLTAADYVIHMDPWWNPAVEDQASDRAHRIGQTHPVTVYRLVTQNTIEEKIVQLHQDKRDLANSLLEGSDLSGKISTEELLTLLKGR